MFNQEDEIDQFFREQEGYSEKQDPTPEKEPDDGLPSIMRALKEPPKDDPQASAFPSGGFAPARFEEGAFPEEHSVEEKGFHDSGAARYDRLKEMEEQLERDERTSRCSVLSKKYMQMFLILIGGIALNAVSTILTNIASRNEDFYDGAKVFMIIVAVASAAISVLYGLILIGLGKYFMEFKTAGVYYMISGCCEAVYHSTTGLAAVAFSILGAVFSVLYILKFAVAMSNSFDNVASYVAVSWENFRKIFIYVYGGIVACTILSFFPILNIMAGFVLIFLMIAAIFVSIWQIVLVFRSSNVMKQYSTAIHA